MMTKKQTAYQALEDLAARAASFTVRELIMPYIKELEANQRQPDSFAAEREKDIVTATQALATAAKTFRWYEELHAAKPDEEKAKRNADLAVIMEHAFNALTLPKVIIEPVKVHPAFRLAHIQRELKERGVVDVSFTIDPEARDTEAVANEAADLLEAVLQGKTTPAPKLGDSKGLKPFDKPAPDTEDKLQATLDWIKANAGDHESAEHLDFLEAYLSSSIKRGGWPERQPMSSAPRDGKPILVLFKGLGWHRVIWTDSDGDSKSEYASWHVDDNKHGPYGLRGYNEEDELGWLPLPPEDE